MKCICIWFDSDLRQRYMHTHTHIQFRSVFTWPIYNRMRTNFDAFTSVVNMHRKFFKTIEKQIHAPTIKMVGNGIFGSSLHDTLLSSLSSAYQTIHIAVCMFEWARANTNDLRSMLCWRFQSVTSSKMTDVQDGKKKKKLNFCISYWCTAIESKLTVWLFHGHNSNWRRR